MNEFTPENLQIIGDEVRDLRMRLLTEVEDCGADPMAEQHYLTALSYLELAVRSFRLAKMEQSRGLAGR